MQPAVFAPDPGVVLATAEVDPGAGKGAEIAASKHALDQIASIRGWVITGNALHHHDHLVAYQALMMAVATRGGTDVIQTDRLRYHTDRGAEFTAGHYRKACARIGLHHSMG